MTYLSTSGKARGDWVFLIGTFNVTRSDFSPPEVNLSRGSNLLKRLRKKATGTRGRGKGRSGGQVS